MATDFKIVEKYEVHVEKPVESCVKKGAITE